jgi:hypothetical protein
MERSVRRRVERPGGCKRDRARAPGIGLTAASAAATVVQPVLHASERAADRGRIPVQRRTSPIDPAAERLLALQRSAGNQAVARLIAGQRTLARVDVADVEAECKHDPSTAAVDRVSS